MTLRLGAEGIRKRLEAECNKHREERFRMWVLQGNDAGEQESRGAGCAEGQVGRLIEKHRTDKRTSEISDCISSHWTSGKEGDEPFASCPCEEPFGLLGSALGTEFKQR